MGRGTAGPGQCGSDLTFCQVADLRLERILNPLCLFMFRTAPSPFSDDTYYARNCFEFSEGEQLFMKAIILILIHVGIINTPYFVDDNKTKKIFYFHQVRSTPERLLRGDN